MVHTVCLILALVLLVSCKLPADLETESLVTNFRFSPAAFDSFKQSTVLRYSLAAPSEVSCMIIRRTPAADALVTILCANVRESKGTHAHTWIGDTAVGQFAPAGDYIGVVRVRDRGFEATVRVYHE